ncbi:hypothetical protein [Metabacillus hrfriensis]|uniref:Uncharacterized protein n=1 Tax=Metabacillus hrfriensis TaxID=3048891 RepID=A0ACD4RFC6_9BACI|nr:hypothetical protein [Metabacillus sp. CT-WN-B3]WHZ59148.1 hypothetical protein QLQ22_07405 [Metabacillus sp. CT-WN-B3]
MMKTISEIGTVMNETKQVNVLNANFAGAEDLPRFPYGAGA